MQKLNSFLALLAGSLLISIVVSALFTSPTSPILSMILGGVWGFIFGCVERYFLNRGK